jgi:hypothetical protein
MHILAGLECRDERVFGQDWRYTFSDAKAFCRNLAILKKRWMREEKKGFGVKI